MIFGHHCKDVWEYKFGGPNEFDPSHMLILLGVHIHVHHVMPRVVIMA